MRNYQIVNINEPVTNLQGYQKILTNNIDQIINHSADNVLCSCLEYQDKNNLQEIIAKALSKLKPKGQLNVSFANLKKIFDDFLNSRVSGTQVFDALKGKNSIIVIEDILSIIDINTFKVVNINYNEYNINIVIERVII